MKKTHAPIEDDFGHLQGVIHTALKARKPDENDHMISEVIAARILDDAEARAVEAKRKHNSNLEFIVHQNDKGWGVYCRGNFLKRYTNKSDADQGVRVFQIKIAGGMTLDDILRELYGN